MSNPRRPVPDEQLREGRDERPIYRRVSLRDWEQGTFSELSPLPPSGQSLSLLLNLSRLSTIIPGVSIAGRGACLDLMPTWTSEDIDQGLENLKANGAHVDLPKSLIFQPWVLNDAAPESPNVVKAWRRRWRELPPCEVKAKIDDHVRRFLSNYGASKAGGDPQVWIRAWDPALAESSAEVAATITPRLSEEPSDPSRKGNSGQVASFAESGNRIQSFSSQQREAAGSSQWTDGSQQNSYERKGKSVEKGNPLALSAPFECTCGELIQESADRTKWNIAGDVHRHSSSALDGHRVGGGAN